MASLNILGVRHDYELTAPSSNSGITFVFIHGWLLSRQYWLPLIQVLSDSHGCLSYDLRGFGCSESIPGNYTPHEDDAFGLERAIASFQQSHQPFVSTPHPLIASMEKLFAERCHQSYYSPASYARDLLILLDKLEIQRPWLVGHSLGGTIALWAAAALGDRIEGVVCLNSGGGIYIKESFDKFRAVGQRITQFRPRWLQGVPGLDWCFSRANVSTPLARKWGQQQIQDFVMADAEAAKGALLDSTTPEEVHLLPQLVQSLKLPLYFIGGQNDKVMELKYIYHLASFYAQFSEGESNVFELPNCGHLGMVEHPDAIALHLQEILRRSHLTQASK